MAAPRFLLSPSGEEGAASWDPRDDRAPMSSSSSLECVSLEDQGQDIGAFGSINPVPLPWGDVWVGGLRASRLWSHYLGVTAFQRHLGQDYKQRPLPWLSGTPKSPAYCPKACGRGRQLGGEWLQPVFPINIPKWPLAGSGAGRRGGEGRGGLRHPRAQGPS